MSTQSSEEEDRGISDHDKWSEFARASWRLVCGLNHPAEDDYVSVMAQKFLDIQAGKTSIDAEMAKLDQLATDMRPSPRIQEVNRRRRDYGEHRTEDL
jgi:hypothetical protein